MRTVIERNAPRPLSPVTEEVTEAALLDRSVREITAVRRTTTALLLLSLIVAGYFAKDILLPLVLGLVIALTLSPVVRGAGRAGLPPPLTAGLLVLSLSGLLGFGGYFASGPVTAFVQDVPEMGRQMAERMESLFQSVEKVQEASQEVEQITDQAGNSAVQKVAIQQPGILNSAVSNLASAGTTLAVSLVMAYFVLSSGDMFYSKLVETFQTMSEKKRALRIVFGVERAISRYLLTITLINAGLGVAIGILMTLVGLPNGYMFGFIAFAFNFLPFLGAIAGTILAGAYAVLSFDSLSYALLAPGLYLAATSFEGQFVTPTILGRRLELNTVSVFITVVFWGWLWGIAGALMAVPFLVIVKVVADNVPGWQVLGNFLGSNSIRIDVPENSGEEAQAV